MKLSIYIPTLRRDALFDRCLKSIDRSIAAAGTAGVEHEIVVIEGVSPLAEARNEGIRRTAGDWIACVDADDEVEESWFGEICNAIRLAERPGAEIDDIIFDSTVVLHGRELPRTLNRPQIVPAHVLVDDMLRDMRIGNYVWLHVMNRRLWAGERFDEVRVNGIEDFVTMPRVVGKARQVLYVPRRLYRYIAREGSLADAFRLFSVFEIAVERAARFVKPAAIGACVAAYNCLYDRVDRNGAARRWIRRHLLTVLADREVDAKWKLKFVLAAVGILIRRPK